MVFLDLLGVGLIMPLVTTVSKSVQMSALVFGVISSAYAFAQFLSNPVMGQLSDSYGRKRIFLVSLAGVLTTSTILTVCRHSSLVPPSWHSHHSVDGVHK